MNTFQRMPLGAPTRRTSLAIAVGLALAGCAVGPDFKSPDAPANAGTSYVPGTQVSQTDSATGLAGDAQRFVADRDVPADWWTLFHSPELDQLVRAALEHNPSMAGAQASLRQAEETYTAQRGNLLFPSVNAQAGIERQRESAVQSFTPGGLTFNAYSASVNVSYAVDVFGLNRRQLENAHAAVDYQRYQLEATYLTLSTNVVLTAIREASARAQLKATNDVLESQEKELHVIEKQYSVGAIPRTTLLTQQNQVAQTRASIPALEKALQQAQHQLSVYVGKLPSESGMPEFQLDSLQLPQELPLSLPSKLVRQRPDILAAEAQLHEANAQVGVATANMYPQINLTGAYGYQALHPNDLFNSSSSYWSIAGGLLQPLFNGGALSAQRRASLAALDAAGAQYKTTVLTAFQNVADTLSALQSDASTLKAEVEVESLARESMELSQKQFKLGGISYLVLLDAERNYQQAHVALVQAQSARYSDTAALFQALGGGWWNQDGHQQATASNNGAANVSTK